MAVQSVTRSRVRVLRGLGMAAILSALALGPASAQPLPGPVPDPVPSVAFVARNDVPFDALAVGPVAGALGGVVAITAPTSLAPEARQLLIDTGPDVVFIAGGTAAISAQVESEINAAGPWTVQRLSGANRNATAQLVAGVLDAQGVGRPLLTGAQVTGDAALGGRLAVRSLHVLEGVDAATLGGVPAPSFGPIHGSRDRNLSRGAVTDAGTTVRTVTFTAPQDGFVLATGKVFAANSGASADTIVGFLTLDWDADPASLFEASFDIVQAPLAAGGEVNLPFSAVVPVPAGAHTVAMVLASSTAAVGAQHNAASLAVVFSPFGSGSAVGAVP
jgi:hypothetical protein